MMPLVAGDDPGEGAGRDGRAVGGHAAERRRAVEVAEERQRGAAHGGELAEERVERPRVEVGVRDVRVLVEAGKRVHLVARGGHGAEREHPLDVDDVADDLAHAPLARRVPMAGALLAERADEGDGLLELPLERVEHVAGGDELHVARVVLDVLVGAGRREQRGWGESRHTDTGEAGWGAGGRSG